MTNQTLELYGKYQERVWAECIREARGNEVEAEDLFQEAWMRVTQALDGKAADASDAGWILGVACNVLREARRAKARRMRYEDEYARLAAREAAPGAGSLPPGRWVENLIESSVAALSPRRRQVVELRVVEDLSTKDIADQLSVATGTVKATMHAARRQLAGPLRPLLDLMQRGDL